MWPWSVPTCLLWTVKLGASGGHRRPHGPRKIWAHFIHTVLTCIMHNAAGLAECQVLSGYWVGLSAGLLKNLKSKCWSLEWQVSLKDPVVLITMHAALSPGKQPLKVPNLKTLTLFYPFAWARERISIKMLNAESRFVLGPSNILFAGMCACTFRPRNVTSCGSKGVKQGWI